MSLIIACHEMLAEAIDKSVPLRAELAAASDETSVRRIIRAHVEPYGAVMRIDLLPTRWFGRRSIVCIIDMQTAEQMRAAQLGLGVATFGNYSLAVVVEDPSFRLGLPGSDGGVG